MTTNGAICGAPRRGEVQPDGSRVGVGEPCKRRPGEGTSHPGAGACSWHGGCLPSQVEQAHQELVVQECRRGLLRLGIDAQPLADIGEAIDTLFAIGGSLRAFQAGLEEKVAELDSVGYAHPIRGEQVRSEVDVYLRVSRELANLLTSLGKLDIDERRIRISEVQSQRVLAAVEGGLAEVDMDDETVTALRVAIANRLRTAERVGP